MDTSGVQDLPCLESLAQTSGDEIPDVPIPAVPSPTDTVLRSTNLGTEHQLASPGQDAVNPQAINKG